MILHKKDIEKIADILKKFKDVETFELEVEHCSGIGSVVTMTFNQTVNGTQGSFEVEISGVESW